jgi:hypothetical protein
LPDGELLHVYLSRGIVEVETIGRLQPGDSLRLSGVAQLRLSALTEAEVRTIIGRIYTELGRRIHFGANVAALDQTDALLGVGNTVPVTWDGTVEGLPGGIDDVLATGGTSRATAELVERIGGKVVGISCLIELEFLEALVDRRVDGIVLARGPALTGILNGIDESSGLVANCKIRSRRQATDR